MLKVENLTLYYKSNNTKKYLLNDVSFHLNRGDCLGIISKTGDGKSTLAKALLGIYDTNVICEKGEIKIDNLPFIKNFRGKKISLIFQNPNSYLNPQMKLGKQIDEMLIYHYKENKKIAKQKALSLMENVGIENSKRIYNCYPHEISGGMQQRICLCISLICNPDILVLDECTSYLDNDSKENIIKLIKVLQNKYNFTLIIISHDFKEIYSMCNKIAIMRRGQMIEFGDKDEIFLNPIHPYTIELICDYYRYTANETIFTCPLMEIELLQAPPITNISSTHYVRSWYLDDRAIKVTLPSNIKEIKEKVYETIRNR